MTCRPLSAEDDSFHESFLETSALGFGQTGRNKPKTQGLSHQVEDFE